MKRWTCALLVGAALASPAWADEDETPAAPGWWRPYVGVGYTWGGQTLFPAKIKIIDSDKVYDEDLSAGGGLDLRVGLQIRPGGGPLSIKASLAHHVDGASGLNGWASFHRTPIELAVGWSPSERWTVSLGARHSAKAQLREHFDEYSYTSETAGNVTTPADFRYQFKSRPAVFAEVEWLVSNNLALQARLVHERFQLKSAQFSSKYDYQSADYGNQGQVYRGSHFGLMLAYYFR